MNPTTLLLVRHGQTEDNVAQIMQGQTQGRLTAYGRRQAEELAARLADTHIDTFVSSDLRRAIDTCAIIAQPHALPVTTTPLLRERDWGSFTGRFIPSLKGEPWPPDIESLDALRERAKAFLAFVRATYGGQTVLAVGHGIVNKAIQSVFFDRPMNEVAKMDNAEVRTLRL